jgi:hypothetical protein
MAALGRKQRFTLRHYRKTPAKAIAAAPERPASGKLISRWHRDDRAARAGLMNGAHRKAVKSEIRAALRAKALGVPLSPHAEAAMLWIAWLRRTEGDQAAKRVPCMGGVATGAFQNLIILTSVRIIIKCPYE